MDRQGKGKETRTAPVFELDAKAVRIWVIRQRVTAGDAITQEPLVTNEPSQTSNLGAEADSGLPEIMSRYTQTFLWLQRYDKDMLTEPAGQSGGTLPSEAQATPRWRS